MGRPPHDRAPEQALDWHRAGIGAALVTVVETWGSAPRPAGSQLAVSGEAAMAGSVSGGCVEAAVVAEALDAIADGAPRLLEYGVSDAEAFAAGLACGGRIRLLLEPVGAALSPDLLAHLVRARATRRPVAYSVDLATWERRLTGPDGPHADRFRDDLSGIEGGLFVTIHNAPLRLAIVGAAHIAQPLVALAHTCGYDLALIDPRTAFATKARFPGVAISHDWPDKALIQHGLDARTAVVTLAHDPKIDDPALSTALASDAFYIGCLGSRRTHAARCDRLRAAGVSDADLQRLHAPVGLAIGAKTPAEIALAIMSQMTAVLRRAATGGV